MNPPGTIEMDVAVLGGGTAGPLVARKLLDRTSARIALVEAGPDYGALPEGRWPADLLDGSTLPASHDWGYAAPGRGGVWQLGRARVIGGCSAHNGCSQTVGSREDYDALGIPWSPNELDRRVVGLLGALRAEVPRDEELTPFQAAALEALIESDVPRTDDLVDLDGSVGCGPTPVNAPEGVRWNSAFAFLDDVRLNDRLRIVDNTLVDRLLVDAGRVTGALCRQGDRELVIRAQEFVLCGGAFGSPEILLRSGIGPAVDLEALGIAVQIDLAGVGSNLHDHPSVEIRFGAAPVLVTATQEFSTRRRAPDEQVIGKARTAGGPNPYDVHLFPYTDLATGALECVLPVAVLRPRSRGRLTLTAADPSIRAHVDHAYLIDPEGADAASLERGLQIAHRISRSHALRPLLGPVIPDPTTGSERTYGHYWHPAGTCAMGDDPGSGAVVDSSGRVHGAENLRVIDASVFPDVPRATTHLPVLLIADRLSDELVQATA